jgi:hypothetical protein
MGLTAWDRRLTLCDAATDAEGLPTWRRPAVQHRPEACARNVKLLRWPVNDPLAVSCVATIFWQAATGKRLATLCRFAWPSSEAFEESGGSVFSERATFAAKPRSHGYLGKTQERWPMSGHGTLLVRLPKSTTLARAKQSPLI